MTKQFIKSAFGWGFLLWLIGYILGIVFFAFVPPAYLGWAIMPFGLAVTLWVLAKKIHFSVFKEYVWLAVVWTLIAIICDYLFLVLVFKPADGYYKLDVIIYYILCLALPLLFGWKKICSRATTIK